MDKSQHYTRALSLSLQMIRYLICSIRPTQIQAEIVSDFLLPTITLINRAELINSMLAPCLLAALCSATIGLVVQITSCPSYTTHTPRILELQTKVSIKDWI